jgi:folate-binding protein YgfZ
MGGDDNRRMTTPALALTPSTATLNGAVKLPDWGLIRAAGPDAASFLQGQLTQDVLSLAVGQARLAGFCSPKGRLLASFIVWRDGPESFNLACSADLLAVTLKRLNMFVMRAKCKLSDASGDMNLWGLVGSGAATALAATEQQPAWAVTLQGETLAVRLPDVGQVPRWLVAAPVAHDFSPLPSLALADWQWLEVQSGLVRIVAATADAFVPQMVNFELVGGVNFKKGCYPGQEVVARSQYRGTLKRRAALLGSTVPLQAGQEVFHSADPGQPAGTVALSAGPVAGGYVALTELKLAALGGGSLHLGSADGATLVPMALPYPMPGDEA